MNRTFGNKLDFDLGKLRLGTSAHGKGVFAAVPFITGEILLRFVGPILNGQDLQQLNDDDHCMQIGDDKYFGPTGEIDDFVNHSCDPNAGVLFVQDGVFLIALRDIAANEELTWDYSTTMDDADWVLKCSCGSANCRGVVAHFSSLPRATQERYAKLNVVPPWMCKKYNLNRHNA